MFLLPIRKMAKRSPGASSRRAAFLVAAPDEESLINRLIGAFQIHAERDHDFHNAPKTNPIIPAKASVVYGCFRRDLSIAFDKLLLTAPT